MHKIFILIFFSTSILAVEPSDDFKTPVRKKNPGIFQKETPGSTAHKERVLRGTREALEEGQAGASSDGSKTGEKVRRFGRYINLKGYTLEELSSIYDRWIKQYVRIRNNQSRGIAQELSVVEAFRFMSNNVKENDIQVFPIKLPPSSRKIEERVVQTRPDAVSKEKKIILEVKTLKPNTTLFMTDQLRAQFQQAKQKGFSHYLVFVTDTDIVNNFPRPSLPVSEAAHKIRLYDKENNLYRWVKPKPPLKRGLWAKAIDLATPEQVPNKRALKSPIIGSPFHPKTKSMRRTDTP